MQVIQEHSEAFLQEMNTEAIALPLEVLDLVTFDIQHSKSREEANRRLSVFLKEEATEDRVRKVFTVASEKLVYGRKNRFVSNIVQKLLQG